MSLDLILKNGIVIDGSGTPGFTGDVGVEEDRIAAIGDLSARRARRELDIAGKVVAPGFIDAHTHDDGALLTTQGMVPKISQGVTTVVAGNCGISLAPLRFSDAVPPPFTLVGARDDFRFDDFGDYLQALGAAGTVTNAALLIGHTTLRQGVMPRLDRPARHAEISRMRNRVDAAMEQGAFGLSTGLDYAPAVESSTAEVMALARAAARHGGLYATHIRNYFEKLDEALEEAIEIAAGAGAKLVISHHQVTGRANFGKGAATLGRLDAARRTQPIAQDAYPYAATSTTLRLERCDTGIRILITWSDSFPELANQELSDIARRWNCTEREAGERLLPAGAVYFQLDEADVRCILRHPLTMIGSDGLPHDHHPHPRLWGAFARVLGHYVRDVGLFTPEEAVFRMTGLPAREFGIEERGRIAVGHFADLVVFDPGTVSDTATFEDPARPAAGIEEVWVNGVSVWRVGRSTGERPGRVLRRVRPARV